jgi:acyl transferase domain-containing protein/NADPH:quinone reductase-like Zn-dependent oxidoreductase
MPNPNAANAHRALPVEPVAIVGRAARLPGAPDPETFWRLLAGGRDAISRGGDAAPAGRVPGTDRFDPEFFGISPREAAAIDPQQRLVLELAWEALEDARIPADGLGRAREAGGVFVGAIAADYATLVGRAGPGALSRHSLTGLSRGVIANRVSYLLGLSGPSLAVDSGQSSSLVAVHLACESLRAGESSLALAGGVGLNLAADGAAALERFGALSPDGRCHTFDARANGFVRGEGGGLVVLKTLTRALADGDRIHALILGGAVNQDGATQGLTVPSAEAQREVIRAAVRAAGVDPAEVQYVELHGTGTRVGDPIEAAGVGAALGRVQGRAEPLAVGSVKTNIGHLEGAAGVAGLLKVVASLEHRALPASLNFETPNPEIDLDGLRLRVAVGDGERAPLAWPRPERRLVAGVSSFGVGGTNCHLVLAEPPQLTADPAGTAAARPAAAYAWPLSGRSPGALRAQAERLRAFVESDDALGPADVALSLATTRADFEHRAVAVGADRAELLDALTALARGDQGDDLVRGVARRRAHGEAGPATGAGPVFVFPGQGSQWPGMAAGLLAESAVFAEHIAACADALAPHLDWSLLDVLRRAPGATSLDRADVVQPVLFAVMTSLAQVWRDWGVEPSAVIGHSQGEIAAAYVAGALSLDDAAKIVALRSRALSRIAGTGAMASIAAPAEDVRARIAERADRLAVAAVNGPSATVVSGIPDAVEELLGGYEAEGVRVRRIAVDYASHSPAVEPLRDELARLLAGIVPQPSNIAFYSTVTGGRLETTELTAEYWYRNLRQSVELDRAVTAAARDGLTRFVESSPHPSLTGGVAQSAEAAGAREVFTVGTLAREHGGSRRLLASVGRYHAAGGSVRWDRIIGPATIVDLPTYAFQRRRFWFDDAAGSAARAGSDGGTLASALELVRSSAASVLGHGSAEAVDAASTFHDLGLDSVGAVEFRDRLAAAGGVPLPAALTFDHPTPQAVAEFLERAASGSAETAGTRPEPGGAVESELDDDPVVIVAASGRWPGGARSPRELWRLLRAETDAIGTFPENRGWDLAGLYDPKAARPGTSYTVHGGFLEDADTFDAAFFGISPREAAAMDPQQRVLLEAAWELYENAGIDPSDVRGSRTGVYVGVIAQDYGPPLHRTPDGFEGHALTGSFGSVASGRLSYTLGFEGPAVTIDTACSSSLVAIHLAAQALRGGECEAAVAGGVTVMSGPGMFTEFSRQGGLAADGRCKPFAAGADGTSWAEGVGLVLLENLSAARRAGHPVLAVLRGSAVNQDGASNGLTAPNGPAQERVIRAALAVAGLTPADVDVLEAHGTGTALGDPIEAGAVLATYGRDRDPERPLLLGSVKSNLGHTQAAAGVTGVISLIGSLRDGVLPRTLHVDAPTPHADWSAGTVRLLTDTAEWPSTDRPRRAAVSSFGISGTNAHLILEQAPQDPDTTQSANEAPELPAAWTLSAKTEPALREQAGRLRDWLLSEGEDADAADVAVSLAGRTRFARRAVVVADERGRYLDALARLADGAEPLPGTEVGRAVRTRRAPTAILFTGQGSQRAGMGRELHRLSPVFAAAFDAAVDELDPHLARPLAPLVFAEPGSPEAELLNRTEFAQPALFALEVALFRLAESAGLTADYLIGHSVGEIAAAHVAGVLSLPDAAKLVAARGRLMQAARTDGAMIAFQGGEEEIRPLIEADPRLDLAAVNGPRAVVVSGDAEAVEQLAESWRGRGRKAKRLQVSHAFHSAHMDSALGEFRRVAEELEYAEPLIPIVSNVAGRLAEPGELTDPEYWVRHIRAAVRFHDGVRALDALGVSAYAELGPDAVLSALVHGAFESEDDDAPDGDKPGRSIVAALRPGRPEGQTFISALARLHAGGVPISWSALWPRARGRGGDGPPTYAFQRRRFWLDAPEPAARPVGGLDASDHPFLTGELDLAGGEGLVLTGPISAGGAPWLADHVVHGSAIVPGTAFLDLARHAARRVDLGRVEELTLEAPLPVPAAGGSATIQVRVGAAERDGTRTVAIHSRTAAGAGWTRHASGRLAPAVASEASEPGAWPPPRAETVDISRLYDELAERGYRYGPTFRGVEAVWRRGEELFAQVQLPASASGFGLHPALLDAALHPVVGILLGAAPGDAAWLPFSWNGVQNPAPGAEALRVVLTRRADSSVRLVAADFAGAPVLSVDELVFRAASPNRLSDSAFYRLDWRPLAAGAPAPGDRRVFEFFDVPGGPADRFDDVSALVLDRVQRHAADSANESVLVIVTHGAVAVDESEDIAELASSGVWGLVRSAQAEHPGRFLLLDTDGSADPDTVRSLPPELSQAAIRRGGFLTSRLKAVTGDEPQTLVPPTGDVSWRLDVSTPGSLDNLTLLPCPEARAQLAPGQVRVAIRAAGLNVRDVLVSLGRYPGGARIGAEGAGVVLEVGAGVTGLAPGDRVTGLIPGTLGPVAVTDRRLLTAVPAGWTFTEAAAVPVAFLTARLAPANGPESAEAFDPFDVDPDRIAATLAELAGLADSGALTPPPIAAWDVRQAPAALRLLDRARQAGDKLVLTFPAPPDPEGTVLVTGGTGALGALAARRLVQRHGIKHLVLASRRGPRAPGAAELVGELRELGAEAKVVACDAADPGALDALLAAIPAEHPLTGVVHTAGVLDDGLLSGLTPDRLAGVARAKADAAWHLHERTRGLDLPVFVLYSSAIAVLGNAGQAGYGAANGFLDALARHRTRRGARAVSIGWGHWAESGGMAGRLSRAQADRLAARGLAPTSDEEALRLLDEAFDTPHAAVLAGRVDPAAFADAAPPAPSAAVRERPGVTAGALDGIAQLSPAERRRRLLTFVRETAAAVLGHDGADAIDAELGFMEGEFDSLTMVELRNKLAAASGLRLSAAAVFDHPTPRALAEHLDLLLTPPEPAEPVADAGDTGDADLDALTAASDEELFRLLDSLDSEGELT